jgi:hypothetical protein
MISLSIRLSAGGTRMMIESTRKKCADIDAAKRRNDGLTKWG